jgi:hypothetical protein
MADDTKDNAKAKAEEEASKRRKEHAGTKEAPMTGTLTDIFDKDAKGVGAGK